MLWISFLVLVTLASSVLSLNKARGEDNSVQEEHRQATLLSWWNECTFARAAAAITNKAAMTLGMRCDGALDIRAD
ncbi:hypothetical protein B0H12DRAFT_1323807 [Mycena haematopus]|nr:hypothetical protein B0H12DRAFT_1323807 [Mycena haematopus]